jgi:hypothetical protein
MHAVAVMDLRTNLNCLRPLDKRVHAPGMQVVEDQLTALPLFFVEPHQAVPQTFGTIVLMG